MKKFNRAISILLILFICSVSSSCLKIEDTNGDDTSLTTITDSQIINSKNSSTIMSTSTDLGLKGSMTVKKFSGVINVKKIKVSEPKELSYKIDWQSGNLRLCIVCNNKIYSDLIIDGEFHTISIYEQGTYKIKAAGESAGFNIEYKIKTI